jgi:hypothetical protein
MLKIEVGNRISFNYTNWKGETLKRTVYVDEIVYGSNQWHKEPQFFIKGLDTDKIETRFFAMKDISNLSK